MYCRWKQMLCLPNWQIVAYWILFWFPYARAYTCPTECSGVVSASSSFQNFFDSCGQFELSNRVCVLLSPFSQAYLQLCFPSRVRKVVHLHSIYKFFYGLPSQNWSLHPLWMHYSSASKLVQSDCFPYYPTPNDLPCPRTPLNQPGNLLQSTHSYWWVSLSTWRREVRSSWVNRWNASPIN